MCPVMRLGEVVTVLDSLAAPAWAEPWDNVGLITGDLASRVERVLFTIDYTEAVAEEAEAGQVDLVVAYHPPLFEAVRKLPAESVVTRAIRKNIALYSPHTALDVAPLGTNDVLADVVGLASVSRAPLRSKSPEERASGRGLGRVGDFAAPRRREDVLVAIKTALGVAHVLVAGPLDGAIVRIAVSAGACGDLYKEAVLAGAELYLTGEMRHHDALACAAANMTVVCVLHSNSERKALASYAERLALGAPGLKIVLSKRDRDPFVIA